MAIKHRGGDASTAEAEAAAAAAASSSDDALLYTTMSILGLPVQVQVKDGSLYSGVLHTACFDDAHGVVLKRATKIRDGKSVSNLGLGDYVDTLLVLSKDLVQLVVKDVPLHSRGAVSGNTSNGVGTINCNTDTHTTSLISEGENKSLGNGDSFSDPKLIPSAASDKKNAGQVTEDRKDGNCSQKEAEPLPQVISVHERQIAISSKKGEKCRTPSDKQLVNGQCLRSSDRNNVQCAGATSKPVQLVVPDSKTVTSSNSLPSDVKISSTCSSVSTNSFVPEKKIVNPVTKESKLNPGAQIFTPKFPSSKPVPQNATTVVSPRYIPVMSIAGQQLGTEVSPLPNHSSTPGKLVAFNTIVPGQTGIAAQYAHPVLGYPNVRHQPLRLNGQYHPMQVGPPSVHPQPQAMFGRPGQLVYVNPITQDAIQGHPIITQGLAQPLLTTFPANLQKIQGTAAPTMQIPITPPLVAGISSTVFAPSQHSLPQPFPAAIPIMVPGGTGFFSNRFQ